jgi:hypothetical protein
LIKVSAYYLIGARGNLAQAFCELSNSDQIIREVIASSKQFLRIVTFRFDSREFANLLLYRAKNGVDIEVITNPSDNVAKDSLRPVVETMYKELENNNIKLFVSTWEAGEPELTPTSMSGKQSASAGIGEKWYSLHLQILINENEALITSRPLTGDKTIDVYYRTSNTEFIDTALKTFERVKKLFVTPKKVNGLVIPGEATNYLDDKMLNETVELFKVSID